MLSTVYDHSTIKTMTTHTAEIISDMHNGDVVEEDGVILCGACSISVNPRKHPQATPKRLTGDTPTMSQNRAVGLVTMSMHGVPNQFSFWKYWGKNDNFHVQFHM